MTASRSGDLRDQEPLKESSVGARWATKTVVQARMLPRRTEIRLTHTVAEALGAVGLGATPLVVGWYIFRSDLLVNVLSAIVCLGLPLLLFVVGIWDLVISDEGLRFRRVLGWSDFVPWKDVISIASVDKRPATLRSRIITGVPCSMASSDFLEISTVRANYFFPVRDAGAFRRALEAYGRSALLVIK